MQWLNYHHLYYFYTIASEGSVTKATVKLKLAQSTLSAQLKQFESTIGYQLFERKNRRLVLTDVGRRVYDYAHEIFALGDELRDSIADFESSLSVQLKVGVIDSVPKQLSKKLVKFALGDFRAKITIVEGRLGHLSKELRQHHLDLVLANDKPPVDDRGSAFYARLIGELPVVFVAHPDLLELKSGFPRSLNHKPFILPSDASPLRNEILEHFNIKRLEPQIIAETNDVDLQKILTLDGLGVSAMPIMAIEEELKRGELIRLSHTPLCHESLWLISTHRLVHNPISKKLLKEFRPT